VAANTVEERILLLQEDKRALSDVSTGSTTLTLTRDILLQLLE
jgi:SNF2 family DNA or RNA helicase